MIKTYRDIQLIEKDSGHYLAIACDVSAAIGSKEHDVVRVDNEVAGFYAAAVPLMELLAVGAKPISVINTLGVEMETSGREIITGIKKAMAMAGVDEDALTGSTEDNMPTSSTCVGVTIVSEMNKGDLEALMPQKGQHVYLVGVPKVGQRFLEEEVHGKMGEVIDIGLVKSLREHKAIGHMLPVGSKGVRHELDTLVRMNDLKFIMSDIGDVDLDVSAGPATCMLVCCYKKDEMYLKLRCKQPAIQIGILM